MKPKRCIFLLTILCLLSACATPLPSVTATRQPDTITPTTAPTLTPLVSTLTSTPAIPTPIPTLSPEDTKALLFGLLADNGGCQLPCLWGVTPGRINQSDLGSFFGQFPEEREENDIYIRRYSSSLDLQYIKTLTRMRVFFSSSDDAKWLTLFANDYKINTSEESYGSPEFNQLLKYYLPQQILANYGAPTQILIVPFFDIPQSTVAFFYEPQHFYIEYSAVTEMMDENYLWCPDKVTVSLYVWNPEQSPLLEQIAALESTELVTTSFQSFRSIEDGTSLSSEEFYQRFSNPENSMCLEMPVDKWKDFEWIKK